MSKKETMGDVEIDVEQALIALSEKGERAANALRCIGFSWDYTVQGGDYWAAQSLNLRDNKRLTKRARRIIRNTILERMEK